MDEEDAYYQMFFGVSCAFFALRFVSEVDDSDDERFAIGNRMAKGSAQLLGLLIWRIQKESRIEKSEILRKLDDARNVIDELKKRRSEDAKANEKVVRIISAREQRWFDERRRLRQQIEALESEMSIAEKSASEFREKLNELERLIEEEKSMRKEAENAASELRREACRHSDELLKHKAAFDELLSNQRQLETEMGRALRQVDAAKQEVDAALERKEESVLVAQRLSMELMRLRKDSEQKDQILSAMLRKSKLDTAEKEMLLKEMRTSKARRKQAETETSRWKAISESKRQQHPLKNMLSKRIGKPVVAKAMASDSGGDCHCQLEAMKGLEALSLMSEPYLCQGMTDGSQFMSSDEWIDADTEAYEIMIERRHDLEIDAFVEQLRLRDERLEALRWHLLSMELESKRLQALVERLDHDCTQAKCGNMKLEALLLDREAELHSLKGQLALQFLPLNLQKPNSSPAQTKNHDGAWSITRALRRKQGQRMHEMKPIPEEITQAAENEKADDTPKDIVLTHEHPKSEIQATSDPPTGQCHIRQASMESIDQANVETGQGSSKPSHSTWKPDIHALGVSYKIKRLKQQLIMLDRLTGKQESHENGEDSSNGQVKGFYALTSLLNKQIDRYQSLQGKTDDICQRMCKMQDDGDLNLDCGSSAISRTSNETKILERFLEETFQLQRYIVATGQKLMEVQGKIAVCDLEKVEKPEMFDMQRFSDSMRTVLREVQRGLEVRVSRIIGDIEGALACDGIMHLKK